MAIESFDADALLKRQEELKKGNVEYSGLSDIAEVIDLAKKTKKVYKYGSDIVVDSSMTFNEHIAILSMDGLNSENIYDKYNESKETLKEFNQKGKGTDALDEYMNLELDIYAREIFVRKPELRGDFSYEDLKRVQRSLSDENSVLNKSFKDRDVHLRSVNVRLAQKERALENSCRQQNPEAFSYLDEYEKKMNETMAEFTPLNLRTISNSKACGLYRFLNSAGKKLKVIEKCGGYGIFRGDNNEYTPLGKKVENVIENEKFNVFNYVEYLKQDTAYQKFAEECKAEGMSLGQTVSLYTLEYGEKIIEDLTNEDNKRRQSANHKTEEGTKHKTSDDSTK